MDYLKFFVTYIQLMAGINFAFIIGDFVKKALIVLFDSEGLLDSKYKATNEQIAADQSSINAMTILKKPDGATNEEDLNRFKDDYETLSKQWEDRYNELKEELKKIQSARGFSILFLFSSIYSVFLLLIIAILQSIEYNWHMELFMCVFNVCSMGIMMVYMVKVYRQQIERISKESLSCIRWFAYALLVSGFVVFCNWRFVAHDIIWCSPISWMCNCINVLCILIPTLPLLFSSIYIVVNDIRAKKNIRQLSNDFQAKFEELHTEKVSKDVIYSTFKQPVKYT